MAITVPNNFSTGTPIDGSEIEANNNAIKTWLNGNMDPSDLKTSTWCRSSMFMNGYYSAIINQFEFTTGVVQGAPERPKFMPGAAGVSIGDADNQLTIDGSGLTKLPRTWINFHCEKDARVTFKCNGEMYPLDDDTGTYSDQAKSTIIAVQVDETIQDKTKHIAQAMIDVGSQGGTGDFIPTYEGIRQYCTEITMELTAGDHTIGLVCASNEQITWFGRYSLSLEVYY
tara:strand:- start:2532 stop:3215 length:684 start_codon:yes stop_codon:yes gene_type:complete